MRQLDVNNCRRSGYLSHLTTESPECKKCSYLHSCSIGPEKQAQAAFRSAKTSAKIKVKNMKLLINGKYLPQHATYTVVNTEATGPEKVLSTSALVALKDKGNADDEFSFEFEVLAKVP